MPEENVIIDELKKICGNVFISRLDSLAKDAIYSREFAEYLHKVGENRGIDRRRKAVMCLIRVISIWYPKVR